MKFSRRLRGFADRPFWLIVWQAAAVLINQRLLLVSPLDTVKALAKACAHQGLLASNRVQCRPHFDRLFIGAGGGMLVCGSCTHQPAAA